jgi:DNA primase
VVEGYTDVLALHQAGIRESVAIMGTALTNEQVNELTLAAPVIVLALDADRSGQEAMLRAAERAKDRKVELLAVQMPSGTDPADILAAGGAEAFATLLEDALAIVQFQVRRVLADADLGTPTGRDTALKEAGDLIAATSEGTAMRDELVREAADRLDVPSEYVVQAAKKTRVAAETHPPSGRFSAGKVTLGAESEFLTLCLASGELGRRYVSQATDDQFSSELMLKARRHLVSHFDDPLVGLHEDDIELGALVHDLAHAAQGRSTQSESRLRMSILQLEKRRLEREIRRAPQEGNHARQSELAAELQRVRGELDEVMGQTA